MGVQDLSKVFPQPCLKVQGNDNPIIIVIAPLTLGNQSLLTLVYNNLEVPSKPKRTGLGLSVVHLCCEFRELVGAYWVHSMTIALHQLGWDWE